METTEMVEMFEESFQQIMMDEDMQERFVEEHYAELKAERQAAGEEG